MRHEKLIEQSDYDRVDVSAVWPASPSLAPLPIPDIEQPAQTKAFAPTPAAADVPAAVGGMILAAYAALITAFAIATAGSAHSAYAITIAALFVVVFFTVPLVFLAVEPKVSGRPSLQEFMREGMNTLTGHCTGAAALVQMLIVPVLLTLAALAMGIAAALIF